MTPFTDLQLDALRELANIGSGTAGTALSALLGRPVDIAVPTAAALPRADAISVAGGPEELRHGVVVPIGGELEDVDTALVLDSALAVEGEQCSLSFLMLPAAGGVRVLLERLGL